MVNFNDPMYGFAPRMSIPSYSTAPPPASFAPSAAPMPQQQPRGLLGMLGLGNTGLGGFVDSRRARLAAFGAGLASGRTLGEGLALGAQGAAGARQTDIQNATNQQKLSKTREWFQKMSASDPFYADLMHAIDAGMPMQDAWAAAMKHQTGNDGSADYFGTPLALKDAEGNFAGYGLPSKGGTFRELDPGEGRQFASPYDQSFLKSSGATSGKLSAEMLNRLPSELARGESAVSQINALIENPGLNQIVGQWEQFRPTMLMSDEAADAFAKLEQITGVAFLEAYQMLKGGGQITEVEGAKAEAAKARLGRYQNEDDFRQALMDFRDAVIDGMAKLRAAAGSAPGQPRTPAGWTDYGNGVRVREVP